MADVISKIKKNFYVKFDSEEIKEILINAAVNRIDDSDITEEDFVKIVSDSNYYDVDFEDVVIAFETTIDI